MPFQVPISVAKSIYPEYTFISALTPSEQKAAFHVRDQQGNHLCLKIISPSYDITRLTREMIALRSLSHNNVVRFKDYICSIAQNKHCIIEEFIEGSDFTDLLSGSPLRRNHVSELFIQLCDGLSALKSIGIVHRDLKPSNIRIRNDGSPVIIDFGLARHLTLPDLTLTGQGARIGTPLYFAPEQFRGTKYDIDFRTDLFAIGELMYYSLIGFHPFYVVGMTDQQFEESVCVSTSYINAQFQSLPQEWQFLLNKLLQKERIKRPFDSNQVIPILTKLRSI